MIQFDLLKNNNKSAWVKRDCVEGRMRRDWLNGMENGWRIINTQDLGEPDWLEYNK